jgi:ArsR family metal-binding transcriptional regulator
MLCRYCDCFRLKKYCDGCNCKDCANTVCISGFVELLNTVVNAKYLQASTEADRNAAIGQILDRNPDAFL